MDMTLRPVWRSEILLVALVALLSLGALWLALASSVHQVRHSVLRFLAKAFPLWWVIVIIPTSLSISRFPLASRLRQMKPSDSRRTGLRPSPIAYGNLVTLESLAKVTIYGERE